MSRIAWTYSIANVDTLSWCGMNESTVPCHFSIDFFYDPLERLIIAFVEPGYGQSKAAVILPPPLFTYTNTPNFSIGGGVR